MVVVWYPEIMSINDIADFGCFEGYYILYVIFIGEQRYEVVICPVFSLLFGRFLVLGVLFGLV